MLEMLKRGQCIRLTVFGGSMIPFIYHGDTVVIEPAPMIRLGDIALVRTTDFLDENARYVLHRIVKKSSAGDFHICGDAQKISEGPFKKDQLIGRIAQVNHNSRIRKMTYGGWYLAGRMWIWTAPLSYYFLNFLRFLRHH